MHMTIAMWAWALAAVGLTGFLLGCFFRVPAVAAASLVFAPAWCALGAAAGLSLATILIATLCGLFALQAAYLVGFLLVGWISSDDPRAGSAPSQPRLPQRRSVERHAMLARRIGD